MYYLMSLPGHSLFQDPLIDSVVLFNHSNTQTFEAPGPINIKLVSPTVSYVLADVDVLPTKYLDSHVFEEPIPEVTDVVVLDNTRRSTRNKKYTSMAQRIFSP